MTDEQIIEAVRSGAFTLVPSPVGDRKWYVGHYGDADIDPNAFVLILYLFEDQFEGEDMCGLMMGCLTRSANEWNIEDAKAGKYQSDTSADGEIPF